MGQRTQMYIIDRTDSAFYGEGNPNNKPEKTQVFMYHNQWGYGYRMINDVSAFLFATRNRELPEQTKEKIACFCPSIYFEQEIKDEQAKLPLSSNLEYWANMVDYGDNNNGIVVLEILRNHFGRIEQGNIVCFTGYEDTDTTETKSVENYVKMFSENTDDFLEMWKQIANWFDIKDLG